MKKNILERLNPALLLLARVGASSMMMVHGTNKWAKLMAGGEIKFYDFLYLGPTVSLVLTVIAELVAPAFLIMGLFTRLSAALVAFTMFVAAFFVHAGDPFDDREPSLTYLVLFALLIITGAGRWSIDAWLEQRKSANPMNNK